MKHKNYFRLFQSHPRVTQYGTGATEACLWNFVLGNRQMKGYEFERRCPVLNYTASFLCTPLLLIIDIEDRNMNEQRKNLAERRRTILQGAGFCLMEFRSQDVLMKTSAVREQIWRKIEDLERISPRELLFAPQKNIEEFRAALFVPARNHHEPAGMTKLKE